MTVSTSTVVSTVAEIIEAAKINNTAPYAAADTKIKSAVRTEINKRMMSAIDALDMPQAKIYKALGESIKGSKIVVKVEVDATQVLANKIIALSQAFEVLVSGEFKIDGVDYERLQVILAEGSAVADEALVNKIDSALEITSRTQAAGVDLQAHLDQFLAQANVGSFYSVAQIVKFRSTVAPEGLASSGAVASRLLPASGKATSFKGEFTVQARVEGVSPLGIVVN